MTEAPDALLEAVLREALTGLTSTPKTLSPWLFYDEHGSHLFEAITALPEYYLTRTERAIFAKHGPVLPLLLKEPVTIAELGAGSASKTGILLKEFVDAQSGVLYQPIDISPTALDEAAASIAEKIPGARVEPQVANYITDRYNITRLPGHRVLALYIGSSIGNFTPSDARDVLRNLRAQLLPGDALLLGTDLRPNGGPDAHKTEATLLAAYDDAAGTTAAFNLNILTRLNRDLGADFDTQNFRHRACWNPTESRIEMHLESLTNQRVHIPANSAGPALTLHFAPGETIHTENSYKFTPTSVAALLTSANFTATNSWQDPHHLFAVTLAEAV